ncbi:hypothetical protein N182_24805 [Sinorhizobium sp. GL2]|nr:hypothetical protein N182_24805 [Sinorhizobium sp. GL2]
MTTRCSDLPLFAWQPPRKVIAFPMVYRIGKIRDVARKMLEKTSDRHAEYYQRQVTDGLVAQLGKIGLPETEQDEQIGAFWRKVEQEMVRITYQQSSAGNHDPLGAA